MILEKPKLTKKTDRHKIPDTQKRVFLCFMFPKTSDLDYIDLYLCKVCHYRGVSTFFSPAVQRTLGRLGVVLHQTYESQSKAKLLETFSTE